MDWILLESVTSNTMTVSIVIRKSEVCGGTFWVRHFSNPKTKRQLLFILTSLILKAYSISISFPVVYFSPQVFRKQNSMPPSFSKKNSISETTLRHISVVTTVPSSISSKNGETRSLDKKLPFPKSSQLSGLSLRGQVAQVWCQRSWPWSVLTGPWLWLI